MRVSPTRSRRAAVQELTLLERDPPPGLGVERRLAQISRDGGDETVRRRCHLHRSVAGEVDVVREPVVALRGLREWTSCSPSNAMLTTGVSKIEASMAMVEATFTMTSLCRRVSARCCWLSAVTSTASPSPAPTVSRNGFSRITSGVASNSA